MTDPNLDVCSACGRTRHVDHLARAAVDGGQATILVCIDHVGCASHIAGTDPDDRRHWEQAIHARQQRMRDHVGRRRS